MVSVKRRNVGGTLLNQIPRNLSAWDGIIHVSSLAPYVLRPSPTLKNLI